MATVEEVVDKMKGRFNADAAAGTGPHIPV